jgi:hypothetical protein
MWFAQLAQNSVITGLGREPQSVPLLNLRALDNLRMATMLEGTEQALPTAKSDQTLCRHCIIGTALAQNDSGERNELWK